MSKKYIPSGYQIINLGDVGLDDDNTEITLSKGFSDDVDSLIEWAIHGCKKPVIIQLYDGYSDVEYLTFPFITIKGSDIYLRLVGTYYLIDILVDLESQEITVTLIMG